MGEEKDEESSSSGSEAERQSETHREYEPRYTFTRRLQKYTFTGLLQKALLIILGICIVAWAILIFGTGECEGGMCGLYVIIIVPLLFVSGLTLFLLVSVTILDKFE